MYSMPATKASGKETPSKQVSTASVELTAATTWTRAGFLVIESMQIEVIGLIYE